MKERMTRILRYIGAALIFGLLVLAVLGIGAHLGSQQHIATQARSLGPTVSHLERIGELASARIHVTDILMADGEGFRGAWLIKGDALLACDVSRAKILNFNPTARTATLRLPPLRVSARRSPRVTNQPPPPQLHDRKGRVAIGLTLAILSFPLMASCDRTPKRPAPTNPLPNKPVSIKPSPPARPGRTIIFQGLDNDFRGSTTVLPDDRVIHHKEPP